MEPNFQTSFIPKKPIIQERVASASSIGLFMIVAIFILFTVLLASGGLYFYKAAKERNISQMQIDLDLARNRFEPERITELELLDRRLRASTEILGKHKTITPIFESLQDITMKTVRYTAFSYTAENNSDVTIKLSGVAVGYKSIALQSDIFTENKYLIDPVFSNLTLDDRGNVIFNLDFSVDPSFVDYKQALLKENEGSSGEVIDIESPLDVPSPIIPN